MKETILTFTAILAICIAGSEGPFFPWINFVAGSVFVFIGSYVSKQY